MAEIIYLEWKTEAIKEELQHYIEFLENDLAELQAEANRKKSLATLLQENNNLLQLYDVQEVDYNNIHNTYTRRLNLLYCLMEDTCMYFDILGEMFALPLVLENVKEILRKDTPKMAVTLLLNIVKNLCCDLA